jgi:putative permease
MGQILSWIFIVPPLVFVLLNDGRAIRNHFFQLVPNRGFESFYLVTNKIKDGISDYIQAKIIEAILLGAAVTLGLSLIGAPYTLVLGLIAGITNIIPYLGPFLGALPGLFAITLIPHSNSMILAVGLVYLIANLLDTFLIFPLVVAKLVKLHPLLLICVVAVGEQYYGLVGMLISIPVATAIKVILQEVYITVYGQSSFNK